MAHARRQIRDALVTAVTGLATTGSRVYKSRSLPLTAADLPALCVYAREDTPDYSLGRMAKTPQRTVELHVEGYVKVETSATSLGGGAWQVSSEAVDNTLDAIATEVETAVFANGALAALCTTGLYLGRQELRTDALGDENVGVIDMIFLANYFSTEGTPEVIG